MSHIKLGNVDSDKVELGYALLSEEHRPKELVDYAQQAEASGFTFATISDHYHPWTHQQGQSPFAWTTMGAIANATKTLQLGTSVTCPLIRIHPAIIAQAAATAASLMPDRFFLGVGTGENLNEHILGADWPPYEVRSAMLEEAVELIRELWKGKSTSYYGNFYIVENAQVFTLPKNSVPIIVAAEGPNAAKLAGKIGDGFICTNPSRELVDTFKAQGDNADLPCYCQLTVCYDTDEATARKTAHKQWPIAIIPGLLNRDLPTPKHFEQAAKLVTEEQIAEKIVCGADSKKHIEIIQKYVDAGFRKISIHNIGANQEAFLEFYKEKILPQISKL